ncbi:MAG: GxxExxY protein [Thiothrix sp.]|nr:GxxExxY protein [Thiothrix sp.]
MERDPLTEKVIGCAIEVHRHLGPGLLESTYESCLAHELATQGVAFQTQVPIPIEYKGTNISCGYRIDIFVDGRAILELKSVERLVGVHEAQILTYMKLAKVKTGLLINFNVRRLIDGIKRFRL